MIDDNATYEELLAEAMRLASPEICQTMAEFCLRLAQAPGITDDQLMDLATEAMRWREAAITKSAAEHDTNQEPRQ